MGNPLPCGIQRRPFIGVYRLLPVIFLPAFLFSCLVPWKPTLPPPPWLFIFQWCMSEQIDAEARAEISSSKVEYEGERWKGKWWLTLASSAFGHYVTHFSSRQSELWPTVSNAAAVRRAEGGVTRTSVGGGGKRVRSVTIGAARRQVLLWFDSLWSVHLSQMSSFIIAELYRTRRTDEMYSEGLDKGLS